MSLTLPLLLALGCAHTPRDPGPARGLVGVRYLALDEGLVVTGVVPGSGAEQAGIAVGDRVVGVDAARLGAVEAAALAAMLPGPPGETLTLTVAGPLGAAERVVPVTRGARPEREDRQEVGEILDLRQALSRGSPARAERAAERLVEADFAGEIPGRAAARALRQEGRGRPQAAAAAARVLAEARPEDMDLQFLAAEALYRAGAYAEAVERLRRVEAGRPPDLLDAQGGRGDAGGDPWGRSMLARSLQALGRLDEAAEVATALARARAGGSLLEELGLPGLPEEPWHAAMTPIPDFAVTLLDGSSWSLEAQRGRPVLINFWASWCAPCMQELPHLEALWQQKGREGVSILAVSVDDPGDRAAVDRTVRRLNLTMPVTHAPELAARFGVGPIPSSRLLGRDGALRLVDQGWSPSGMARMTRQVELALAESAQTHPVLGRARSAGESRLLGFRSLQGVGDLALDAEGGLLGLAGSVPARLTLTAEGPQVALPMPGPPELKADARVAWLEGPVAASPGDPWVRAWTPEGGSRWFLTVPGPIEDLVATGGLLWVATEDEILALNGEGAVTLRVPGGAEDLAAGDGGLWAVDGQTRRWITASGAEAPSPAPDGACALANGGVASRIAVSCVSGRFGADGGARAVLAREDGVIVGLDARGQPAFTLALQAESRLAAADLDGDGRDALLVAVRGQGLAWVALTLP